MSLIGHDDYSKRRISSVLVQVASRNERRAFHNEVSEGKSDVYSVEADNAQLRHDPARLMDFTSSLLSPHRLSLLL
jgi:hypothetical protein